MNQKIMTNRSERGQSLVEFAFSISVLLILVVGIVDGGRALFTYMAVREAAQEGALYGSYEPSDIGGIEERVRDSSNAFDGLTMGVDYTVAVDTIPAGYDPCSGMGIRVTVTRLNFQLTMPFMGAILGRQTFPIGASITDTILRPPCTS